LSSPRSILKQFWGYDQFRPLQEEIVRSVAEGRDTLALLPTGGGKSICFQVPAMMNDGLCLVITPLIALMKDQVENLNRRGIPAFAIYAGMQTRDVDKVLALAREGEIKFLYVSPERLQSRRFRWYCEVLPVKLIAVDEAHCISQWGYDFRPAYLQIASVREHFPDAPILALTATATQKVKEDICERLQLRNPAVFVKSFARANLSYNVLEQEGKVGKVRQILERVPGSAVVYCRNRRQTKDIAELLVAQGISAGYYHAGLPATERASRQEAWIRNEIRVMVCTNAFGMGIDKPDVRMVVHADVPDSIEAYYQEAGRAGRDEQKAYAVLLYHEHDLQEMKERIPLQFPSLEEIREVYQAIVNYLQVPIGSIEGVYYDFDINDFVKRFSINITLAFSVLRILEQEGFLQLSESVFMPSRAEFVRDRDGLYDYEQINPGMEPLIKTLLRTYEGIFDNPVPIFERQLAKLMRIGEQDVIHDLKLLHRQAVISYQPRKDQPQLCFLQERVSAHYLRVDMALLQQRRKAMEERIDAIAAYVRNSEVCRTQQLVAYFGEQDAEPCGVCDVCMKKQKGGMKLKEFGELTKAVLGALQETRTLEALMQQVNAEEGRVLETLQFLIAEGCVLRDKNGMLSAIKEP
jgi:ATP-dependent DNA helicase RecQ